jgi:hypothetical protein
MVRHPASFPSKEDLMPPSSNALSCCAPLLLAGAALAGPTAQAGVILLQNQLPVAASCVVGTHHASLIADGRPLITRYPLFEANISPLESCGSSARFGMWPVEQRFDARFEPDTYTVSPTFVALDVSCRVGAAGDDGREYVARFINPDFRSLQDTAPGTATDAFADAYPLTSYTPTDSSRFLLRLHPTVAATTAAELRTGAPLSLELAVLPVAVAPDPQWISIGDFEMKAQVLDMGALMPSVSVTETESERAQSVQSGT